MDQGSVLTPKASRAGKRAACIASAATRDDISKSMPMASSSWCVCVVATPSKFPDARVGLGSSRREADRPILAECAAHGAPKRHPGHTVRGCAS